MVVVYGIPKTRTHWFCNLCGAKRDTDFTDSFCEGRMYTCLECRFNVCVDCINIMQGKAIMWCKECIELRRRRVNIKK